MEAVRDKRPQREEFKQGDAADLRSQQYYWEDIKEINKEGAERATGVWDTKKDAIDQGKKIAKESESELVIHTKDGKIEASEII